MIESVSLAEVIAAARGRQASLVPETSGYILLGAIRAMGGRPMKVDPSDIRLDTDGLVAIDGGRERRAPSATAAGLRELLRRLLRVGQGNPTALESVADPPDGSPVPLDKLFTGVTRALIPINRSAAKRALARLARETLRAKARRLLDDDALTEALAGWEAYDVVAAEPAPAEGPAATRDDARDDAHERPADGAEASAPRAVAATPAPASTASAPERAALRTPSPTPSISVDVAEDDDWDDIDADIDLLTPTPRPTVEPTPTFADPAIDVAHEVAVVKEAKGERAAEDPASTAQAKAERAAEEAATAERAAEDQASAAQAKAERAAAEAATVAQAKTDESAGESAARGDAASALADTAVALAEPADDDGVEDEPEGHVEDEPEGHVEDEPEGHEAGDADDAEEDLEIEVDVAPMLALTPPPTTVAHDDEDLSWSLEAPPVAEAREAEADDVAEEACEGSDESADAPVPTPPAGGAQLDPARAGGEEDLEEPVAETRPKPKTETELAEVLFAAASALPPQGPRIEPPTFAKAPGEQGSVEDLLAQLDAGDRDHDPVLAAAASLQRMMGLDLSPFPAAVMAMHEDDLEDEAPLRRPSLIELPPERVPDGQLEALEALSVSIPLENLDESAPIALQATCDVEHLDEASATNADEDAADDGALDDEDLDAGVDEDLEGQDTGDEDDLDEDEDEDDDEDEDEDEDFDEDEDEDDFDEDFDEDEDDFDEDDDEDEDEDEDDLVEDDDDENVVDDAEPLAASPEDESPTPIETAEEGEGVAQSISPPPAAVTDRFTATPPPRRRAVMWAAAAALLAGGLAAAEGLTDRGPLRLLADRLTSPAASDAPVGQCIAELRLHDLPERHEILLGLGEAPLTTRPVPTGVRLEMVATAAAHEPERVVIPVDANWVEVEEGRRQLAVSMTLERGESDHWPTAPAGEVGGIGPAGRVHVATSPNAEIWLVAAAGRGSDATIQVACGADANLLIIDPGQPRRQRRLSVASALLDTAARTGGADLSGKL